MATTSLNGRTPETVRREIGRSRMTSSVPRWRSPATAAAAKPIAKIATRMIEIGWM